MKHLFIINPIAGTKNISENIVSEIKNVLKDDNYIVHITSKVGDGLDFVKKYLKENTNEEVRIYSCGGDGTLNEVVNGAYGYDNAQIACYPSGSGNDFLKYFGNPKVFLDIKELVNGNVVKSDLIKADDRYVINIFNIGFDANVVVRQARIKRWPFMTGRSAYNLGVLFSVLHKITSQFKVTIDDEVVFNGKAILCAIANAICYGGGFYCCPKALINDGIMDICLIKKISRVTFAKLVKIYKKGEHVDNDKTKTFVLYSKGRKIRIETDRELNYSIDGELKKTKDITLEIVPNAVNFVIPSSITLK